MVESITAESLRTYLSSLREKDLLSEEVTSELEQLAEEMDGFSNWLDASKYLREKNFRKLAGAGPIGKFLRTLTYALERIEENAAALQDRKMRLDRIALRDTASGCSDFRGKLEVVGRNEKGEEVPLLQGPFVWDCAEHGMPQPEAAQKLGYRCMVQFPPFETIPCTTD